MVFYKNGSWDMCKEKVRYSQYNEEITQYVGSEGHDWWVEFEQKWEHTKIIEFIPVIPTEEQIKRYNEIKDMPDGFEYEYSAYVEGGTVPDTLPSMHPLQTIFIQKRYMDAANYMIDLDYMLSMIKLGL
jgi:hypothetical protein